MYRPLDEGDDNTNNPSPESPKTEAPASKSKTKKQIHAANQEIESQIYVKDLSNRSMMMQ